MPRTNRRAMAAVVPLHSIRCSRVRVPLHQARTKSPIQPAARCQTAIVRRRSWACQIPTKEARSMTPVCEAARWSSRALAWASRARLGCRAALRHRSRPEAPQPMTRSGGTGLRASNPKFECLALAQTRGSTLIKREAADTAQTHPLFIMSCWLA